MSPDPYLFIYLAASGLSCSMRDLSLRHTGFSLVVALRLSSCGMWALARSGLVALRHVGSYSPARD